MDQANASPPLRVPIYCARCPVLVWAVYLKDPWWRCQCCGHPLRAVVW